MPNLCFLVKWCGHVSYSLQTCIIMSVFSLNRTTFLWYCMEMHTSKMFPNWILFWITSPFSFLMTLYMEIFVTFLMTLYMETFVTVLHDLTIWVTLRVYYKKNELLALRKLCCSAFYFSVLCVLFCVFCLCPVSCVYPMLSGSLYCPFVIAPSVFSNVYLLDWLHFCIHVDHCMHHSYILILYTVIWVILEL